MNKVLIISSTRGTNLALANKISNLLELDNQVMCLEDFPLPLYTPDAEKPKAEFMNRICQQFIVSDGLIFCAPEYNGGSPPILTNIITWLSVSTDNWREVFNEKKGLIATHSGGAGSRFLATFRVQLEHMGVIVYPRSIMVNRSKKFNVDSASNILTGFVRLL